jgi:hypothetical protein
MAPHEVEITDSEFASSAPSGHTRKPIDSILRVRGTEIIDGHGEPVILKGVSFQNSKDGIEEKHELILAC